MGLQQKHKQLCQLKSPVFTHFSKHSDYSNEFLTTTWNLQIYYAMVRTRKNKD